MYCLKLPRRQAMLLFHVVGYQSRRNGIYFVDIKSKWSILLYLSLLGYLIYFKERVTIQQPITDMLRSPQSLPSNRPWCFAQIGCAIFHEFLDYFVILCLTLWNWQKLYLFVRCGSPWFFLYEDTAMIPVVSADVQSTIWDDDTIYNLYITIYEKPTLSGFLKIGVIWGNYR